MESTKHALAASGLTLTLREVYGDISFLEKLCSQRPDSKVKREHINSAKSLCKRLRGTTSSEVKYEVKIYKIKNGDAAAIGRLYPCQKGFVSYQNMLGKMARILQAGLYVEVDLKNCHFMILAGIFPQYPAFTTYCTEREDILSSVAEGADCPRWQAKTLFIILIYGGSVQTWRTEYNISENAVLPPIVPELVTAVNAVKGELSEKPSFEKYKLAAKHKRAVLDKKPDPFDKLWENTALSFYLQDIERSIVYNAIRFVQQEGIEVGCVKHDGFLINASDKEKVNLEALTGHCRNVTGQSLAFDIKNQDLDEEDLEWKKMVEEGYDCPEAIKKARMEKRSSMTNRLLDIAMHLPGHTTAADLFAEENSNNYAWVGTRWFVFSQPRWDRNGEDLMFKAVNNFFSSAVDVSLGELGAEDDPVDGDLKLLRGLKGKVSDVRWNQGVMHALRTHYKVADPDEWTAGLDTNPDVLGFADGVYDSQLKEFREGRPEDMVTRSCRHRIADIKGDPAVEAHIMRVLHSIHGNPEMVAYVLGSKAALISGRRLLHFFQIYLGCGRNGKGLESRLLEAAFGGYFISPKANMFASSSGNCSSGPSPEVLALQGTRIVIPQESETDQKLKTGFIKGMSGGDSISARGLYEGKEVHFKGTFLIQFLFNKLPINDDACKGIANRMHLISHPFTFVDNPIRANEKQIDLTIPALFASKEYGAVFMHMLIKLYETQGQDFAIPEQVLADGQEYAHGDNALKAFIDEHYEETQEYSDKVPVKNVFLHLQSVGESSKLGIQTSKRLRADMVGLGYSINNKSGREWKVYYLKPKVDEGEE